MTEDILEQIVDGYLKRNSKTFSKHNVKFRPRPGTFQKEETHRYSNHSDIDVLAYDLSEKSCVAVSCKSWQNGFDPRKYLTVLTSSPEKVIGNREGWKAFRELYDPVWAEAFRDKIFDETEQKSFTYVVAVTKLLGTPDDRVAFTHDPKLLSVLSGGDEFEVNIEIWTFKEMFEAIWNEKGSMTLESSEIGRLIQLMKASGLSLLF